MHENIERRLVELAAASVQYRAALSAAKARGHLLLKAVRGDLGLTQRAMAERLGVNHTYLSKVENQRVEAGAPLLLKLIDLVPPGWPKP